MAKIHEIKLKIEFCDDVLNGRKSFEIRHNDRGYQAGDKVKFIPVRERVNASHPIEQETYLITYVLSGWGIQEDWVVFSIVAESRESK